MNLKSAINVLTAVGAVCLALSAQASESEACNAIFEHGISDVTTSSNAYAFDQFLHQNICHEMSGSSNLEKGSKLNLLFDALDFGVRKNARSASEYKEKHCADYQSNQSIAADRYQYIKTISKPALAAWTRCVNATSKGWKPVFDPIDERTITFGLNYTGSGIVQVTGVRIHSDIDGAVLCHTGTRVIDTDNFAPVPISTEGWSMTCERKIDDLTEDSQRYRYGAKSAITILAGGNTFSLSIPEYRSPQAPDQLVEQLRREILDVRMSVIPSRTIVAWYPTNANLVVNPKDPTKKHIVPPTGWLVCDGTNGTPDLADKFILATSTIDAVASTGGSARHSHSGSVGIGAPRGADNGKDFNAAQPHTAHFTTNDAEHWPPHMRMVFIMKQ